MNTGRSAYSDFKSILMTGRLVPNNYACISPNR
jgi:hypothetical protein